MRDARKSNAVYLRHILDAAESVSRYVEGVSESDFDADDMRQKAVIRDLEIIGEATKRLSAEMLERYADVPWREMARMRDKLIHDYMGVEMKTVWVTATTDIPKLAKKIRAILQNAQG